MFIYTLLDYGLDESYALFLCFVLLIIYYEQEFF